MRSHHHGGSLTLLVTRAESFDALLKANETAFIEKFDESASKFADGVETVRVDAAVWRAAADICAGLREAIKKLPSGGCMLGAGIFE